VTERVGREGERERREKREERREKRERERREKRERERRERERGRDSEPQPPFDPSVGSPQQLTSPIYKFPIFETSAPALRGTTAKTELQILLTGVIGIFWVNFDFQQLELGCMTLNPATALPITFPIEASK